FKVAHGENVTRFKGESDPIISRQYPREDDVPSPLRVEFVGPVLLQRTPECDPERFGQPGLKRAVLKKIDLNRARTRRHTVGRTKPVTRAPRQARNQKQEAKPKGETHRLFLSRLLGRFFL